MQSPHGTDVMSRSIADIVEHTILEGFAGQCKRMSHLVDTSRAHNARTHIAGELGAARLEYVSEYTDSTAAWGTWFKENRARIRQCGANLAAWVLINGEVSCD